MEQKLTFRSATHDNGEYPRIRVSREAENIILDISAKTGLTKSFIASEMIRFAAKYTEVE